MQAYPCVREHRRLLGEQLAERPPRQPQRRAQQATAGTSELQRAHGDLYVADKHTVKLHTVHGLTG